MDLISDLSLILIVAGIVTLLFKKLRQPLVLGYIVAGFLVSPHMPYTMSVVHEANIETWADIGVMFLLFSLGLDFSFKKIVKMGIAPVIAALTIIFCMAGLGMTVGKAFGWGRMDCIFLGGMLAMSSTTIIYKAFDDLGLSQQRFASLVMSVLILEDILAIVMMVMLSAIAGGSSPDGTQMVGSILKIAFFLILWFVVGIYLMPSFFRVTRKLMTAETMVIVSLGLCCLMAVISTKVGFSSAFGAFVMGSILAETVEADKIEKVVEPVKNLFGAIFFVSVGMLVDPQIIISYAGPIIALVAAILLGQMVFGTMGFLFSGQDLKTAMRCGFSMAQIGEFAFIIASLGLSLGVISKFLYPVVVAVSVITTFLTPYMMKAADPCYHLLETALPKKWIRRSNHIHIGTPEGSVSHSEWHDLLMAMTVNVVVYGILSGAAIFLMFTFILPLCRHLSVQMTGNHWTGNFVCGVATLLIISPFLRAMIMKKNHSEEFQHLWTENRINRLPLVFTVLARIAIASAFVFYIANYLTRFANAFLVTFTLAIIVIIMLSRRLKKRSISLERRFIENLHSREIAQQVKGTRRPLYEGKLLDRDIHIGEVMIPEDSEWAGKSLRDLHLRNRFGIHVSSILRGRQRLNIPDGQSILFPGDQLQVIGNDEQLQKFSKAAKSELVAEDPTIEKREMKLQQLVLSKDCPFIGKTLRESGIRDEYNCMVVGREEGQENLTLIDPNHCFDPGDIIWVVGEKDNLRRLAIAVGA
ncbi:MAG: cation:proton antiporter [Prevotella sp.]|uniref:cation:proton antiporter n=1 Tax=Prevotella sp. AGR2160 TaxID=1280674 RepID=UPI0003F66071|nr:cation:proton antiporter [Prevotella sp. AGR2160]MDD5862226.1 cation:proton antiporter [Prevotella sp.]